MPQLRARWVAIVRAHTKSSRYENYKMTREDDLIELAADLQMAIVKARALKLPTSAYILSMALVEVSQPLEVARGRDENEPLN